MSLEDRVRRLEDRTELVELTYRYAMAVDDRDFKAIESLFAADATLPGAPGHSHGREAVAEVFRQQLQRFGATVHTPNGHVLRFHDDTHASGQVLSHAELAIDGEAYWVAFRYDDDYVYEEGCWRFASRRVRTVYKMPLRELPRGLAQSDRIRWPYPERAAADLPEGLQTYQESVRDRTCGPA